MSYPVNREESIFTILSEFSDMAHNEIPAPDRAMDNSTYWVDDFSQTHYKDMMFGEGESFKDFYLKQSNGRFLAKGDVSDWVRSRRGRHLRRQRERARGLLELRHRHGQRLVRRAARVGQDRRRGRRYLTQFDQVDRYDADGDGNFNEPDGYIDHFQAIHAGEGEEAGGGVLGEDAIWSHRWYVNSTDIGQTGPGENKLGGVKIGGSTSGSATTPPSRRTAASACSRTSSATTSACRTSTTPRWRQRHRLLDADVRWLVAQRRWQLHRHQARLHGPVEKLQLGWLDYKVVPRHRLHGQARPR